MHDIGEVLGRIFLIKTRLNRKRLGNNMEYELEVSAAAAALVVVVAAQVCMQRGDRRSGRRWAGPITQSRNVQGAYRSVVLKLITQEG